MEISTYAIPGVQANMTVLCAAVSKMFDVDPKDITRRTRKATICRPRQIVMAILYGHYKINGNEVVRAVGLTNHCTAIHSYRQVRNDYFSNRRFRDSLNAAIQPLINPEELSQSMKMRSEDKKNFNLQYYKYE